MKMKKKNNMKNKILNSKSVSIATLLSASLISITASAADTQAASSQSAATTRATEEMNERQARPLWFYGSIGAGYGSAQGSEFGNNPDGTALMLGGVVAYKIPQFVFDGGVYWQQVSLSGTLPSGQSLNIKTRSGLAELSPRYRVSQVFDIGPVAYTSFGTNTNFSATSDGSDTAVFAGLKANYEIPGELLNLRLTAAGARDVTISNRDVYMITAGIQIGLPLTPGKPYRAPAPAPVVIAKAAPERPIVKAELRLSLSPKVVYFNTASAKMGANAQRIVREIGAFLSQNDDNWGALEISGHTDSRGSYKYNMKLSDNRSQTVIEDLARGGARPSKIKAESYAFTRPVATGKDSSSLAQNRRVELIFKNVSNPDLIEKEIKRIVEGQTVTKEKKVTKIPS